MKKKKNIKNVIVAVLLSLFCISAVATLIPKPEKVETRTINEQVEDATGAYYLEVTGERKLVVSELGNTSLGSKNIHSLVIDGGKDGATIKAIGEGNGAIQASAGGELIMKNLTIVDETADVYANGYNNNLRFGGKLRFENCIFSQPIYIKNDAQAEFENCTFHSAKTKFYSVWMADGSTKFENCTFTGYRGVKVHEFTGDDVVNVEIKGCTFQGLIEKVGVAIGVFTVDPLNSTVSMTNNTFIDCQQWDVFGSLEGVDGVYEADMPTNEFIFIEENNKVEYTGTERKIRYIAIEEGEIFEVPELLWKESGKYPTSYTVGEECKIDELYGAVEYIEKDLTCYGWYLDRACTVRFNGTIALDRNEPITLYAKIETGSWTAFY